MCKKKLFFSKKIPTRSGKVRVMEIIPLLIPEEESNDFETTIESVLNDKVKPKSRGY